MIKYITESGTTYTYDPKLHRIKRVGEGEVEDRIWPDKIWQTILDWNDPVPGQRLFLKFTDTQVRITSPVVRIET